MLKVNNLCFSYGKEHTLKQVTAAVQPGELIAIIGPNGGGKTTFLKLLLGILKPSSGTIENAATRASYVPQRLDFDTSFPVTVRDVVLMSHLSKLSLFGTYPKIAHEKCQEAMETLGIASLANQAFGSLSGGQAQKTLIARGLASDPDLLILDEPTANIDPETSKEIIDLIASLKQKKTILMVSHHPESIIGHVDHVFCIQNELTVLDPQEVCKHFAYGTYHTPLLHDKRCDHE